MIKFAHGRRWPGHVCLYIFICKYICIYVYIIHIDEDFDDSGRLATWTKGFKCPGVEGEDVVELLKKAIARQHHAHQNWIILAEMYHAATRDQLDDL